MRDTIIIGTIAGLFGTIAMHLANMVLKSIGMVQITTLQVTSTLFLSWQQANTFYGTIIGAINHFFVGAIVGVAIAFVLKYFGKDYYLIKGLGTTGIGYLAGMGFIIPLINSIPQIRYDTSSLLGHIISFTIFGIIASYIVAHYGEFKVKA